MELSNEIKEDIRKTQSDLKNAIRVHQVWVAHMLEDENNANLRTKVKEAEKNIIAIGHAQKLVLNKLRRELELCQPHLKAKNKFNNIGNGNNSVTQQLKDYLIQYRNRNRTISLLKPSVLNEIQIKNDVNDEDIKDNLYDSENEIKSSNEKEYSNHSENDYKDKIYQRNFTQLPSNVNDSRNNFVNVLNKVKESFIDDNHENNSNWHDERFDSDSSRELDISPTPSPPPLPQTGEHISKETFFKFIGLITPTQKEIIEKKRNERRKRRVANKNEFICGNYDMLPKRKKYNHFPYLQTHSDPPQTRSAKLRKQQSQNKSSREGSPSGSSSENRAWSNNKPAWVSSLPPSLSVEPVFSPAKKVCHGCGRNDVMSLLVWCGGCGVWIHTGCGSEGRCGSCGAPLPDPAHASPARDPEPTYRDKIAERRSLQQKNIQLCVELRKLETRAATLRANLAEHNAEKRKLLSNQINTQRNLQKLLDFISQCKETSISIRSTSLSESSSEISKSCEE